MKYKFLVIVLLILGSCSQNSNENYTDIISNQKELEKNLFSYTEKLSEKGRESFRAQYYAIFYFLEKPQIIKERNIFRINMEYYDAQSANKTTLTKEQIKKEAGLFIEEYQIPKFANYLISLLDIVFKANKNHLGSPAVIKNIMNSFKKEYKVLQKLSNKKIQSTSPVLNKVEKKNKPSNNDNPQNTKKSKSNKQNPCKKYSEFMAFEYAPLIKKLLDYSDALNNKDKKEFWAKYSSVYDFLFDLKLQKLRLIFSMSADYYGDNEYRNLKKEKEIENTIGGFFNKKELGAFAEVFKQVLEIVIRETKLNSTTPIEIKNVIESFENEIILLQRIKAINEK